MAWTPATFKARWRDFVPTDDDVVQAALDEAARSVDDRYFGDKTDDAVGLLAAHKLASSPFGQSARLANDDGTTTYGKQFEEMSRAACGGAHAIGAWLP